VHLRVRDCADVWAQFLVREILACV